MRKKEAYEWIKLWGWFEYSMVTILIGVTSYVIYAYLVLFGIIK